MINIELINRHRHYFEAVAVAHTECAKRQNMSSEVLKAMRMAGAEDMRAIMTAMATLETLHGPVAKTREQMTGRLVHSRIHYGYGSSFVKGKPDPLLMECEKALFEYDTMSGEFKWIGEILSSVVAGRLNSRLYPNMAWYSAILCELIEWPAGFEFLLVCMMRAGEWRKILDA